MNLVYMDTDSFLLKFDGINIYNHINKKPLSDYIDTSNFSKQNESYSDKNKGKLGFFKSETADKRISEVIALAPKSYSIKLDDGGVKSTAKGVSRYHKTNLTHEIYRDVYNRTVPQHIVEGSMIRSFSNTLYTTRYRKVALMLLDRKRFWINPELSYGFGHPAIPLIEGGNKPLSSPVVKKRKVDEAVLNLNVLDLNYRKLKCVKLFSKK